MRKLAPWISAIIALVFIFAWMPAWAGDSEKININTASADDLMNLKGIGEKKAQRIIEFREKNGAFKIPEDLLKVPGIGPKTLEANKDRIILK